MRTTAEHPATCEISVLSPFFERIYGETVLAFAGGGTLVFWNVMGFETASPSMADMPARMRWKKNRNFMES